MKLNLIHHYLFYSCILLNRISLFSRKGETLKLSNLLNIFCHYKISNLLLLVFIFSPKQCYNHSPHLWRCHHIMGKTVRRACYIWLNIIWKLLRPAPESITLQSFTEDFFHLSKCSSHSLYWNYYETCKIVASPLTE